MSDIFTQPTEQVTFLPNRSIGPFQAQVTIEEVCNDSLEITNHPVEQGASITDHAYVNPSSLNISALFSEDQDPLPEIYQNLLELQASREPFTVVTGKRTYNNMLMKSLGVTNDAVTENILSVRFSLQEIFLTSLEVSSVPVRSKQENPGSTGATENAGQKSLQGATNDQKSIALTLFGGS
jgi:hypothetical protein